MYYPCRMQLINDKESWGLVSRLLHWFMVLVIVVQIALGILAESWRLSPTKLDLFVWHKSLGLMILLLVVFRIVWRFFNVTPLLPEGMPTWQKLASRVNVGLLYTCMFALPLSGWGIQSASNVPFKVFWLFPLPDLISLDSQVKDALETAHGLFVVVLVLAILLHMLAAIHHQFTKKDGVITRMWFGKLEN